MKVPKIDWIQAKKEFLLDKYITLKEVAEKYGIGYNNMRKIASKEGWVSDRKPIWQLIDNALTKEMEIVFLRDYRKKMRKIKPSLGKGENNKNERF